MIDRGLLKRYDLSSLLKDEKLLQTILLLFGSLQDKYGRLSLSMMVDFISNVVKYEPSVIKLLLDPDINQKMRDRILNIFSLAVIEQLTKMDYLSPGVTRSEEEPHRELIRSKESLVIITERDSKQIIELKNILRVFNIKPLLLHEQPIEHWTTVETLEEYSNVGFAIVVLGRNGLKSRNINRASPNVLIELGYFIGVLGRNRVLVLIQEGVMCPTDIAGINYVSFKDSINEVQDMLVRELKVAGYE